MKKENQLVSLELAKKMDVLNFENEGFNLWWWVNSPSGYHNSKNGWYLLTANELTMTHEGFNFALPAYTVAELGEMLKEKGTTYYYKVNIEKWGCSNGGNCKKIGYNIEFANTEANARAKFLIYLKEKGLI